MEKCSNTRCEKNVIKGLSAFCSREEGINGCMKWSESISNRTPKKNKNNKI